MKNKQKKKSKGGTEYRRGQRWQMVVDRGGPKVAVCDMCKTNPGKHMHEIAPRRLTIKNYAARKQSYHRMICSWLCPDCHREAHNPHTGTRLLAHNCLLYGTDKVASVWNTLSDMMKRGIPISFPTSEEINGFSKNDH